MDWGHRLVDILDQAFQIEHLTSREGNSYGAGAPMNAPDLLQSAIPREQLEYYADILVDEWAAQHIIDLELGLDSLIEFDFEGSADRSEMVQFLLLDTERGRLYMARKTPGESLSFLVAIDEQARTKLVAASMLAMLAADAAFGQ